jgi:hypothetical protein
MGWDILFCYDGFLENSKPELPHTNLPFSRLSEKRKEVKGKGGGERLSSAADAKVLSPASLSYLYDRQRFPTATGCHPDVRGLCWVAVLRGCCWSLDLLSFRLRAIPPCDIGSSFIDRYTLLCLLALVSE